MRSKRSIITISWYKPVIFDLIRHGLWHDTVGGMTATGSHIDSYSLRGAPPSRGRLFLCPGGLLRRFLLLKHCYLAHRGMPRPYRATPGDFAPFAPQHSKSRSGSLLRGILIFTFLPVFRRFRPVHRMLSTLGMKFRATLRPSLALHIEIAEEENTTAPMRFTSRSFMVSIRPMSR